MGKYWNGYQWRELADEHVRTEPEAELQPEPAPEPAPEPPKEKPYLKKGPRPFFPPDANADGEKE